MIVLASASSTRRAILEAAGVTFSVASAELDESALKETGRRNKWDVGRVAAALAFEKARAVSVGHPGDLVIGADQMLAFGNRWFDKPDDLAMARKQLGALAGATHELISAVALVRDGALLWQTQDRARLTMRAFSQEFLGGYLAKAGPSVCCSVGAYQLEGLGVQLFERIEGDHFTILGLPLLPLLAELRKEGLLLR